MVLPSQTIRVLDPGIGFVDVTGDAPFKLGVSSLGTVGELYSFSQPSAVRAVLGYGDLADEVAKTLIERGGPVLAMRAVGTTAATSSAVAKNGSGTPTPTIAGTPTMRLSTVVRVKVGGAIGTAQFDYAHDNWQPTIVTPTYSTQRVIPGGGVFLFPNTGITMTFPAGTYVAGDTFTFTTEPAHLNAADAAAIVTALLTKAGASPNVWHMTDTFTTATEAGTVGTALGAQMQAAAATYRYARVLFDLGSADTPANAKVAKATLFDVRISPCYGFELTAAALPFEGYGYRYASCAGSIAARAARVSPSASLARYAEGPVNGTKWIALDSNVDGSLDALNISTLRTWANSGSAYYVANGFLAAPPGSDFQKWQYGRLMDIACEAAYASMLPFIEEDLRANPDGTLLAKEAAIINTAGQNAQDAALMQPINSRGTPGLVNAVEFAADETNNITLTSELITFIAIQPKPYASKITQNISYALNVGAAT